MINNKIKNIVFLLISSILWFIVLIYFIRITIDIYKINHINYDGIISRLFDYYSKKESKIKSIAFELPDICDINEKNFNIFVFGESSVVFSDSGTFSQYLEQYLKTSGVDANVFNFGVLGIDSFYIKQRIKQAIRISKVKPRLIVLYLGHNEYSNAYNLIIKDAYPDFNYILKLAYLFSKEKVILGMDLNKKPPRILVGTKYKYYARLKKPVLIDFLQKINLVRISDTAHYEYNRIILDKFKANINEILYTLKNTKIPALIITPIGNYYARPYGNKILVNENFNKGMKEKDYIKALSYLIKAKDNELLTYDIRAKSCLTDYLTSIKSDNIFIINLEAEFQKEHFRFDDSNFLDYYHLKSSTHRLIAEKIKNKMLLENLIKKDDIIKQTNN